VSRGLGAVERQVLTALANRPKGASTTELAWGLFGAAPSSAQVVSLRRSIRSLERKGYVVSRRELAKVVRLARQPGRSN